MLLNYILHWVRQRALLEQLEFLRGGRDEDKYGGKIGVSIQAKANPKTAQINSNFRMTITESHYIIKVHNNASLLS